MLGNPMSGFFLKGSGAVPLAHEPYEAPRWVLGIGSCHLLPAPSSRGCLWGAPVPAVGTRPRFIALSGVEVPVSQEAAYRGTRSSARVMGVGS